MSHDSSHIYKDAPYGISTDDVSYVLGETSGDVGTLCTSNNINKYAKYKPCGGSSPVSPTEAERKQVNCGIDTSNLMFSNLGACLTAAKTYCDWNKATPTTYRLADFDKYYHGARTPYVPQINIQGNTSPGEPGGDVVSINLAIQHNTDMYDGIKVNLQASDLHGALTTNGITIAEYKYGFLYRVVGAPESSYTLIPIPLSTGETIEDGANPQPINVVFDVPSGSDHAVYDCVFIVYAEPQEGGYYATFLPKSYFQANIALFSVTMNGSSIAGQTINAAKEGQTFTLVITGYGWEAESLSNEVLINFSPEEGDATHTTQNVVMEVEASEETSITGYCQCTVRIAAPGRYGTNPDFTKEFFVKQKCDYPSGTGYIERTDAAGTKMSNTIEIPTTEFGETDFYLTYDVSWTRTAIEKNVGGDWFPTTDIQVSPASATLPSGTHHATTACLVYNAVALTAGQEYQVVYTDSQNNPHTFKILVKA